jgi:hypothetical protein
MPKILVNDTWYEPIESASLYEMEFRRVLLQRSLSVFPGYRPVPFGKTVQSEFDSARADYALIADNYGEWWVVEVEMGHHSLEGHIIPQVQTLVTARYGDDIATYLLQKDATLARQKIEDLLRGRPPRVLVVVDRPRPNWTSPLGRVGAELAVFEIFRSDRNRHAYRLNGFVPTIDSRVVTRCHVDRQIPFLIRIDSPAALEFDSDGLVEISCDGRLMKFSRVTSRDATWLSGVQRNPLMSETPYQIIRDQSGMFVFTVDQE